jgi:hypothetical protein
MRGVKMQSARLLYKDKDTATSTDLARVFSHLDPLPQSPGTAVPTRR